MDDYSVRISPWLRCKRGAPRSVVPHPSFLGGARVTTTDSAKQLCLKLPMTHSRQQTHVKTYRSKREKATHKQRLNTLGHTTKINTKPKKSSRKLGRHELARESDLHRRLRDGPLPVYTALRPCERAGAWRPRTRTSNDASHSAY